MHAGLLDVFHHAADEGLAFGIADAVHVAFDRVVQEAVQQHWGVVADLDRFAHVALQVALLVHNFHRAPAQHIAGAYHQRVAQAGGFFQRLGLGARGGVGRLAQRQFAQQGREAFAVFGRVNHVGRGADDGHAVGFQVQRELQRRLAAVLHDHAQRFLLGDDFQHVLQRQRLEVEPVAGVVVSGHGFRVAVDHDGLVAVFPHRQRGVHAAIVELDALADAVRSTAQHHDLLAIGGRGLAFGAGVALVRRVHVGGVGRKLGGAGVYALVHRTYAQGVASPAHGAVAGLEQLGQTAVGEALLLQRAQGLGVQRGQGLLALGQRQLIHLQFELDDLLDLHQKPLVDLGDVVDFVNRPACRKGVAHVPDAVRAGFAQFLFQDFAVLGLFVHAVDADFQAAQRLLERFLEGAAHGHDFAHRFHLRGQARIGGREFLERETRHLGDHVVDAGLKAGRRGTAGDVVAQLVQRVANRQLGRDLGDGKAGGLGGQCRAARHARVHLNHDHTAVLGVDRELHVRAAGVDADLAQYRQRGVAQDLVFLVGQRLRRRHGDGVAGVHAHGVQVFD